MALEVTSLRLPMLLRYADRSSMASGVEVRAPFLDHRVVDLAMRLPAASRFGAAGGKLPLRRAFAGLLPERILAAPKTHGLGMAEQFEVGSLDLGDLLQAPPAAAAEFLDLPRLRTLLATRPGDPLLWFPVSLLLWLRGLE
jgi:asparagine synthase (glutamine-hydrolysing)